MISTPIGGTYSRVADPDWADPVDASFAMEAGGRWNAPGSHPVLYLNADVVTARANVAAKFVGLPYGPEDLAPEAGPHLVDVAVPDGTAWELRSDDGLVAVGLPTTYPDDGHGGTVGWEACQPIGATAHQEGSDGIACRSAAPGGTHELAWFPRASRAAAAVLGRRSFTGWYWDATGSGHRA